MKKILGFSLIELIITISIIGILSALSLPLYTQHIVREKRLEATLTLTQLATAIERYFILHNTYKGASLRVLGFKKEIADHRYELMIEASETKFKVFARPLGKQSIQDHLCATLILNSLGEKSISGQGKVEDCW